MLVFLLPLSPRWPMGNRDPPASDSRTEGESSNPGAGFELDRHAEPAPGVPGHEGDLQTPRDSVSPNPRPAPLLDYNHASVRMSASDCDGDGRAPQPEHDTAVHAPSRSLYRLGFEGSSCRRKRGSEKGSDSCGKVGFYRVVQNEEMRWQSRYSLLTRTINQVQILYCPFPEPSKKASLEGFLFSRVANRVVVVVPFGINQNPPSGHLTP